MKTRKTAKKTEAISIALVAAALLLFGGCGGAFVEVRIPVERQDAIKFKTYQKIYLGAFTLPDRGESFDARESLENFFLNEFSGITKKEVDILPAFAGDSQSPPPLEFPHSLVITGELTLDIKERKIIREQKGGKGKKTRQFVTVQLWEMGLTIVLTEKDTAKRVAEFTFSRILKDADPAKERFNFKSLLDKLTEEFLNKVTRKARLQERFLLLKRGQP